MPIAVPDTAAPARVLTCERMASWTTLPDLADRCLGPARRSTTHDRGRQLTRLYTAPRDLSSRPLVARRLNPGHCPSPTPALPLGPARPQRGAAMTKTTEGNFFEDLTVGREILHATPRTVTEADATLYLALTGSRFCGQLLGDDGAHGRAAAAAARRSPDLPPRVRAQRAGYLAQRDRQSRLRRRPLRRAPLPWRHADASSR